MSDEGKLLRDRYRITSTLGQGGMGAVYMATDESLGVQVAVKENKIDDEDSNRQFKREASILANMRHPNMPRVTDHFVNEDGQYLVMDFVEGEDLRQRLERSGAVTEKEAILVGVAICDALDYLHNQEPPILHRDIKPGNIKVTSSGHVFLVDFGLAKIDQGSGQQTTTGARGLTPGYSPPEQYGSARTDARSDVYALGATIYALITGMPPEDGLSIAIKQSTLTKVTERKPETSTLLAMVIEKALAVNAEDRFQSAGEMRMALLQASDTIQQKVMMGEVTIAPPPPQAFGDQMRQEDGQEGGEPEVTTPSGAAAEPQTITLTLPGGINWGAIAGVVGAIIILVFGAIYFPKIFGGGEEDPTPTVEQVVAEATDTAPPPTDVPEVETATPEGPRPGGEQIAYASLRDGVIQIYLLTGEEDDAPQQLTDMSGGACQPDWSPDGNRLVFLSPCDTHNPDNDKGVMYLLDVNADGTPAGEPQRVSVSERGDNHPRWSPDGTQILFSSPRIASSPTLLFLYDVESDTLVDLDQPATGKTHPDWSSDGNFITFIQNGQVLIMKVGDRSAVALLTVSTGNRTPVWDPTGDTIIYETGNKIWSVRLSSDWQEKLPVNPLTESVLKEGMTIRDSDFSPDGQEIVFSSNSGGDGSGSVHYIYIGDSHGDSQTAITFDTYRNFQPSWRP